EPRVPRPIAAPCLRCPERTGDEHDDAERDGRFGARFTEGVARIGRRVEVGSRTEEARDRGDVHRDGSGNVEVENLLHDAHRLFDGCLKEDELNLDDEGDHRESEEDVESGVAVFGRGAHVGASIAWFLPTTARKRHHPARAGDSGLWEIYERI